MSAGEPGWVEELPWWLEANGVRVAFGTATPDRLEALAAGRLLADGYIERADELLGLVVVEAPPGCMGLRARVPAARMALADAIRVHRAEHGCGVRYYLECDPSALGAPRTDQAIPGFEIFPELFRSLYASADRYRRTGGIHTAALTDGLDLLYPIEDVGRHNAVDKTIGWALLEGADRSALGLVLSARVSAEIAVKAARARLRWIASRSIPTDLAAQIARSAGLPIVARAAGKDARIFGGSELGFAPGSPPRADSDG